LLRERERRHARDPGLLRDEFGESGQREKHAGYRNGKYAGSDGGFKERYAGLRAALHTGESAPQGFFRDSASIRNAMR
jgi:hypothetical protein